MCIISIYTKWCVVGVRDSLIWWLIEPPEACKSLQNNTNMNMICISLFETILLAVQELTELIS